MHAQHVVGRAPVGQRHRAAVGAVTANARVRKVRHRLDAAEEAREDERPVEHLRERERRAHLQQLMVDQSEVRMHERVGDAPDEGRNQHALRMHSGCTQDALRDAIVFGADRAR